MRGTSEAPQKPRERERASYILTGVGVRSQKIPLMRKRGEIKTLFPSGHRRGSEEGAPRLEEEPMGRLQGPDRGGVGGGVDRGLLSGEVRGCLDP